MKKFRNSIAIVCILTISALCFVNVLNSTDDSNTAKAEKTDFHIYNGEMSALEYLCETDIINGYEDGSLHPEYSVSRAEFAKIISKAFELDTSLGETVVFSDVNENHWAYEYINEAVCAGVINGFPDKTFRPDDSITYEQAAAIICRVFGLYGDYDYPAGCIKVAMKYSLTDGVNSLIGEVICREQAAIMVANGLNFANAQVHELAVGSGNRASYGYSQYSSGGGAAYAPTGVDMTADGVTFDVPDNVGDGGFYPYNYNTEEYVSESENVFKNPYTSPLSTFSIDTDTASYSNMRRFILNGENIPRGAIRSEELINYFDYAKATIDSEHPFGVKYTVAQCPWNSDNLLAMVTVSGEELTEPMPSNIVFLIDVSGSMYSFNKLPLVKQSLSMLLDKLGENDTVSIVTYASDTRVALEATPATEKEKILSVLDSLRAGGSTAGASGINLAYAEAEKARVDGNNRVILCTDGDFNVGISSDAELESLISKKRDGGVYLSVLGFGMGNYKDNKMETLADCGNGNYAYIDNLKEAKKVLVDDMSKTIYTIAKDVKIQVEFNPETVGSYRLIGYENRILNDEDFENDQKDAGELGAGATVTVLYEIIPQNGEAHSELKYQSSETSGSGELMTVSVRYKLPEAQESILTEYPVSAEKTEEPGEDFRFASAVAELGMILNNSEYAGSATYDSVIELARKGIGDDPYGIRCEFIQLADLLRLRQS
ncbi:MAG: von Willebrand factor type A domain-containing protein [Clostridia bacterium]|nr:von Willebrand factor type A domain-containing protein [Clostridia bacterium]